MARNYRPKKKRKLDHSHEHDWRIVMIGKQPIGVECVFCEATFPVADPDQRVDVSPGARVPILINGGGGNQYNADLVVDTVEMSASQGQAQVNLSLRMEVDFEELGVGVSAPTGVVL